MRQTVKGIFLGKNVLLSALIALAVIGSMVLGCTCNDKEFSWNLGNSNSQRASDSDNGSDTDRTAVSKADASKGEIPKRDELDAMVKKTLLGFNNALQRQDFTDFHGTISSVWRRQITPRQMKRTFQKLIDGNMNIAIISTMTPIYTSDPKVGSWQGGPQLHVSGKFETSPVNTTFDLKYIPEGSDWKLSGIEIYGPRGTAQ